LNNFLPTNPNNNFFLFRSDRRASGTSEEEDDEHYKEFLNIERLNKIIKTRNNKLSTGHDAVPTYLLKYVPTKLKKWIVILFNNMYNNAHIPAEWKEAKLIPILKPGKNAQLPESYRMVSLLVNLSKVYEVFIKWKLDDHMEGNNIYKDHQFAFWKGHSTSHALAILSKDITNGLNRRCGTLAVGLDLEKAFDKAWTQGIIYKMLTSFSFSDHICRVIKDYLEGRTFRVAIDGKRSTKRNIQAGVPQGSVLGPILYNIFTMDIPTPEDEEIKMLAYADDILIYGSSIRLQTTERKINDYLKEVARYMEGWKLKMNTNKCEVIKICTTNCFRNSRRLKPTIKVNNRKLKVVRNMKYLGHFLNERHKVNTHIDKVIQKCNAGLHAYRKVINYKTRLKPSIKSIFYKQVIRPAIAYAFPAYIDVPPRQMEKLRKLERKCLRQATGLYRRDNLKYYKSQLVYDKAKIIRIDNYLARQALKFLDRCEGSDNQLIREICTQQVGINDRYKGIQHMKSLKEEGQLFDGERIKYYNGGFSSSQYV